MSDDRLQRIWQTRRDRSAGTHPEVERLAALARGDLSANTKLELTDHLIDCSDCSATLQSLMSLQRAVLRPAQPPRILHVRTWWRWAAAAAALPMILAVWWGLQNSPEPETAWRDDQSVIVTRTPDGARLSRSALELAWQPLPRTREATVTLFRADTSIVARIDHIAGDRVTIAAEQLADVQPGTTVFWRVSLLLEDGTQVHGQPRALIVE
jgi:anti-sigma factor ChrR (cupin superfamily)